LKDEPKKKPKDWRIYFFCLLFWLIGFQCGKEPHRNLLYIGPESAEEADSYIYIRLDGE
jgi:hypothetical protein